MIREPSERIIGYVDGFNLYFGLRDSGYQRFYWLNIRAIIENLLQSHQRLVLAKYFTARISGPKPGDDSALAAQLEAKRRRQGIFLEALQTITSLKVYYGHYLGEIVECRNCGRTWTDHEEKMTDVNIATEMLTDAFRDEFDTAFLVSADSDLVPAIKAIKRLFPVKRIIVFFPPGRFSAQLKIVANAQFTIGRGLLAKSQFPDVIAKPDGYVLKRPQEWR